MRSLSPHTTERRHGDVHEAAAEAGVAHRRAAVRREARSVARHDSPLRLRHGRRVNPETVWIVVAEFSHLVQCQREEVDDGVTLDLDARRVDEEKEAAHC